MKTRILGATVVALLLCSLIVFGSTAASSTTSGTLTGWSGNTMQGANYALVTLDAPQSITALTITFSGSGQSATAYCGVMSGAHYPPAVQDQYAWVPKWGFDHTHVTGKTTVNLGCTTQYVLVAVLGAPAPTISVAGGATNTPLPPTATNTPVPPTATPTPSGQNTCHDVGDGAVDQHGVSVDVWAPGLRIACGFAGYENGDNPMPAGTHLPAPRPFRFDSVVDHNEAVFGFKVFYRPGSEAPSGYGGVNGCGDVRVILHQGGAVSGFTTQYHTVQIAMDKCDTQGVHHILDIGGQIDTGCLDLRHNPDSQRCQVDRLTADTLSCNGTTTNVCASVWYAAFGYRVPGGSYDAWHHFGFLVENPVTLYDVNNPAAVHLTGNDGSITMLRDHQFSVPPRSAVSDWWSLWNTTTHVNEVVPAGTPGAWQMHVDNFYYDLTVLEPASGTDHPHPIPGIRYPN